MIKLQQAYNKGFEDCRQAVLNLFNKSDEYNWELCCLKRKIEKIPPVTPQPKTGRWIIIDDCEQFIAKCSECGEVVDSRVISKYPYCHCGAKMVEPQEGAIRNE